MLGGLPRDEMKTTENKETGVQLSSIGEFGPISINERKEVVGFLLLEVESLIYFYFQETKDLHSRHVMRETRAFEVMRKSADCTGYVGSSEYAEIVQ